MLSRFTPYPDELFYSVVSRFHIWSRNTTRKETMEKLFLNPFVSLAIGFPSKLSLVCSQLNHEKLSVMYFINHTTFLPLFRPFIQQERVEKITSLMSDSTTNNARTHMVIGHLEKKKNFLYFCPTCFSENEKIYGEAYWHRTHQVFGVKVCPIHNEWLIESSVSQTSEKLKPLDGEIVNAGKETSQLKTNKLLHLSVAKGVYWILNYHPPNLGLEEINQRYKTILQDTDFLTYQSNIRFKMLIPKIIEYFGEEFLDEMHSNLDSKQKSSWIRGIFKEHAKPIHPVKHLLILTFFGYTPEEFFSLKPRNFKPFGDGPWLCLNYIANHFLQPVIDDCQIQRHDKTGKPNGTFKCSCGFIYNRIGPDIKSSDKFNYNYIKSYGHVWEQKLLDSILKERKSFRKTAKEFKCDRETIKKQFIRLTTQENTSDDFHIKKEKNRNVWLSFIKKYPEKTQSDLRKVANSQYKWLYHNDRKWLINHPPPKKIRHIPKNSDGSFLAKDWVKIDEEISSKINAIAEEIAFQNGKPKRVTTTAISNQLRHKRFLSMNSYRLPRTVQQLNCVLESIEEFQCRRLKWVIGKMVDNNEILTPLKILRKASISHLPITDEVDDILQKALEEF